MILNIDTTNRDKLQLSLSDKDCTVTNISIPATFGSEGIVSSIAGLLKEANVPLADLSHITVNPGPGSYTGIRVGVAVAHALGYCLDIPVNGKRLPNEIIEPVYA